MSDKGNFRPKKKDKIRYCTLCHTCTQNCKELEPITTCEFYERCLTNAEYWREIKGQQVNLRRLTDKHDLKLNMLLAMLEGKAVWSYKYHKVLLSRLNELEEYEKYLEEFDGEE